MSRGLGGLQRRVLEVLRKFAPEVGSVTVQGLARRVFPDVEIERSHMVSLRRAVHGLARRKQVRLAVERLPHEVLVVWLPDWKGPTRQVESSRKRCSDRATFTCGAPPEEGST